MSSSPHSRSSGLIFAAPVVAIVGLIALVMAVAALGGSETGGCGSETLGALSPEVPAKLVPLYENAAAKYHLGTRGPSVLAGINFVETDFGTDMATSSAGAEGWMAFLPSTFAEWGVDGNGDGVTDIFDAADAIFSAANYLHDSGAPGDWWNAVFAYNHADWYVEKVLRYATQFATGSEEVTVTATTSCEAIAAPDEAVARMVAEAERLSLLRPGDEYVWGGSHGESPTPANGPFDCSSAVSHLLQVGGFGIETTDTVGLSTWGEPGPGQWVTIWVKPVYNNGEAHTFIEFMPGVTRPEHRYWGTSGFVEPGHGPGWIPESTFDAGYLRYFEQRHPKGM